MALSGRLLVGMEAASAVAFNGRGVATITDIFMHLTDESHVTPQGAFIPVVRRRSLAKV